ncbi:MAG: hypothetical protein ACXVXC_13720 [Nocardioidaceae bacterium]
MSGRSAHDVLDSQRAIHLQRMRELTAARRTADLRWIEEAAPRVRPDLIRAE